MNFSIGDRMKRYESVFAWTLPRRIPVILRVDGRAFHTLTRGRFGTGYSEEFAEFMMHTALFVRNNIQGCNFAYSQSDEISFLLTDYNTISTEAWFGYDARKMISIAASLASVKFSFQIKDGVSFDARVFSIPHDDVCNYFIWRQCDATRNAIQMAARKYYSHKELHEQSCDDIQDMLFQKGINFNDFSTARKRGWCIAVGTIDTEIPIFSQDRQYVEKHVFCRKD